MAESRQEQVDYNKHVDLGVYHGNIGRAHIVVTENGNLHLVFPFVHLVAVKGALGLPQPFYDLAACNNA